MWGLNQDKNKKNWKIVLLYSFTDTALLYDKNLWKIFAIYLLPRSWVLLCWWSQGQFHLYDRPLYNLSDLAFRLYTGLFHRVPVYKSWNEDCQWNGEGDSGETNPKHSPWMLPEAQEVWDKSGFHLKTWQSHLKIKICSVNKSDNLANNLIYWALRKWVILQKSCTRLKSITLAKSVEFIKVYCTVNRPLIWVRLTYFYPFLAVTYSFSDVDLDDRSGAEGRLAAVPGLHHQRPGAVCLLGDVLNDSHRLNVGLQHDLPCVSVNVKYVVVWLSFHDGILNDIVGYFCILVHSLCGYIALKPWNVLVYTLSE